MAEKERIDVNVTGNALADKAEKLFNENIKKDIDIDKDESYDLDDLKEGKKPKGGFKSFAENVGTALSGFMDGVEKKLETVYDDKEKRALFLSGLNTMIEGSRYTPLTQAKSPIGQISEGVKKGFLESEAIGQKRTKTEIDKIKATAQLEKALKGEPPRIRNMKEESILKDYGSYKEKYKNDRTKYDALDTRYLEAFKLISEGKEIPTGTLEQLLFPIEKVLAGTELGEKINKYFTDGKLNTKLIDTNNVAFKEILNAASKQAIVSQVKDLYPASDKDIQVLLQGIGDVATTPEALIKLISAQKAASEAYKLEGEIAKNLAFEGKDINFDINARDLSLQKVAEQYNDQVPDELLVELYGSADRSSPFRVAQAYFYSTLKPQIKEGTLTNFEIFKQTTENQLEEEKKNLRNFQNQFKS